MDDYIEHMTKGKQPAYWTVLLVIWLALGAPIGIGTGLYYGI